jgi:acyl carrier protein
MTRDDLRGIIDEELANIAPEVAPATVADGADIREGYDIDSMGFLTFVTALHKRLSVNVPESDYPKLFTKRGAIGYLLARLPADTK